MCIDLFMKLVDHLLPVLWALQRPVVEHVEKVVRKVIWSKRAIAIKLINASVTAKVAPGKLDYVRVKGTWQLDW